MKKLLAALAAGSIAFSLTAVTFAEETSSSESSSSSQSQAYARECAKLVGTAKATCLSTAATRKMEHKIVKTTARVQKKIQKLETKAGIQVERISKRLLEKKVRSTYKEKMSTLKPYPVASSSSSKASSVSSSSAMSSSSMSSSSMSSSMSSGQ